MTSDPSFFRLTPSRKRIAVEETAKGYRISATAEGADFDVQIKEGDEDDIGKTIHTTLGAQLASMVIETRQEFKNHHIPLAIPDLIKFIESRGEGKAEGILNQYNKLKKIDVDKESGK